MNTRQPHQIPVAGSVAGDNLDDYQRIAAAIAFLRAHRVEQPDLAAVAQHLHLSESHVQRLFTRWAGISPKRFLQYLTLEYAKSKIAETANLLDLSLEVGLSSPGRLHDLFVSLEAMSPGEYKAGGAGLEIVYGVHPTRFGRALVAMTPRGLCNLLFLDGLDAAESAGEAELRRLWPNAALRHDPTATQTVGDRLLNPLDNPKPISLWVKGTNFQIQVWRSLLQLPPGSLATYRQIAQHLGHPTASRAVGNAIGSNPVALLIPCHRVIRESGELGGYRWGLSRKSALLSWEASQTDSEAGLTQQAPQPPTANLPC
ncbi:methylated-DNA--[protein]-cysteine S-methyltransferase [Thermoleptolyngbya sp. M55_K2018_002]|uniref:methylated-DNA--[protein]-cysteine S-methyltransferase n=1 Tax=Thermoleptolyngbya sp. M55_K2018_002 TaxID=2747808 RepID=UPI0019DD828E|nr:methylated-DNA--[protein]-cysteine S-methyltransferase [Thermoleptolyngbya sp. M55_K2018_002]HIK39752.1 methylated-DNA--[protein]-cysteine S-methyltransferase [Thermoleptolyngbya sp. M55_K2018_002]